MAIPQTQAELLTAIDQNYVRLLRDVRALPASAVNEISLEGHAKGTLISPADLIAYLIGWNELVLKWLEHHQSGQPIDFPETGFKWNQLGQLAQKFYADYAGLDWAQRLERLEQAKRRIVQFIASSDDPTLYGRAWYDKWTLGRMIQFNTASPYANARARLRKWAKGKSIRL
ncbi:ClbS/DfsB family four-helix bundle protein [Affinibrenneria salicis]|uniref:ClbS/DfsB family four-helix bundle protein n=1 Tax=Affinibrenneria salicis TaxID=2590031 RepID=A0A5J5FVY8_9GAMM|nr:ClbS/DfsB family four-helix bundle protein [Affinibrenneria salicis]KAA8998057.1 ClbS/DfsB family four-helix bundle protein [Affinibrenneria salicis]